jgi:protein-S-isoprenylcysteine O-methyltransferase Ste14
MSVLLVCLVVALLFLEQLAGNKLDVAIAWMFIAATLLLTGGLMLFLWEVQLALRSVRVRAADILVQRRQ